MRFVLLFIILSTVYGFLLDSNKPQTNGQSTGSQQFLSMSEFYDSKAILEGRISLLNHDTDNKLKMLSSQIEQMMTTFRSDIVKNCTEIGKKASDSFEPMYKELLNNYTTLQTSFNSLKKQYVKQTSELDKVKNESLKIKNEILDLKNLKGIMNIMDVHNLEIQIQNMNSDIHAVNVKEQARSQDFQAMYNIVTGLQRNQSAMHFELGQHGRLIHNIENNSKVTFNRLYEQLKNETAEISARFNMKIDALKEGTNSSLGEIEQQVTKNSEKVGFTACARDGIVSRGHYLVFPTIPHSYGFKSLSLLQNSGIFTCEESGLYLIVISVTSSTNGGFYFYLFKNTLKRVSKLFIPSTINLTTGTISIILNLNAGDTLELEAQFNIDVLNSNCVSHMTLVKIN